MIVTSVHKSSEALTMSITATFDAPVDAMGMAEGITFAIGQIDGLLSG